METSAASPGVFRHVQVSLTCLFLASLKFYHSKKKNNDVGKLTSFFNKTNRWKLCSASDRRKLFFITYFTKVKDSKIDRINELNLKHSISITFERIKIP